MKEKILAALLNANGAISGEEIAKTLGVSRNAVWKAIKSLKSDGYIIDGVSRIGYTIQNPRDVLSAESIKMYLRSQGEAAIGKAATARTKATDFQKTASIQGKSSANTQKTTDTEKSDDTLLADGRKHDEYYKIVILPETDSTNNYAKQLAANGGAEGTVILTDYQSGGRGRRGRTFLSPKGKGLYMSVILKPLPDISDSIKITSFAAIAAARAIDAQTGAVTKIKWVNDLFLGGKKICGILTEALMDYETMIPSYIILGIGINLRHTDFPPDIAKIATSIEDETGTAPDKNLLAANILYNLKNLEEEIKSGAFLNECKGRSIVIGNEITVNRGNESYEATAIDLDKNGGLIIERQSGNGILSKNRRETLSSGEVSIRVKK